MHMAIYMYKYALQSHKMVTLLWKSELIVFCLVKRDYGKWKCIVLNGSALLISEFNLSKRGFII